MKNLGLYVPPPAVRARYPTRDSRPRRPSASRAPTLERHTAVSSLASFLPSPFPDEKKPCVFHHVPLLRAAFDLILLPPPCPRALQRTEALKRAAASLPAPRTTSSSAAGAENAPPARAVAFDLRDAAADAPRPPREKTASRQTPAQTQDATTKQSSTGKPAPPPLAALCRAAAEGSRAMMRSGVTVFRGARANGLDADADADAVADRTAASANLPGSRRGSRSRGGRGRAGGGPRRTAVKVVVIPKATAGPR